MRNWDGVPLRVLPLKDPGWAMHLQVKDMRVRVEKAILAVAQARGEVRALIQEMRRRPDREPGT